MDENGKTPLCDELASGPWPSHVTELKKTSYHLAMYEEALKARQTQWGFGGYVSLPGVAAGILMRTSARPDITAGANVVRVLGNGGGFYTSAQLRTLCDLSEKHAYGLLHLMSNSGDVEILGIPTDHLKPLVAELNAQGLDVGSTGDDYRNTSECIGMARCDAALVDSMGIRAAWYARFLDDVQFPRFPHKIKTRISGCPNDCAHASQAACLGIVGVFRDAPKINAAALEAFVAAGGPIAHIVSRCPSRAMTWDGRKLEIDPDACVHCMYCINKMSPAVRPGDDRGVALLVGAKMRGKYGPLMGKVLVPFIPVHPPAYTELFDLIERVTEVWDANAKRKERLGDFIFRIGFDEFAEMCEVAPTVQQIAAPRDNAYYHWKSEELGSVNTNQ